MFQFVSNYIREIQKLQIIWPKPAGWPWLADRLGFDMLQSLTYYENYQAVNKAAKICVFSPTAEDLMNNRCLLLTSLIIGMQPALAPRADGIQAFLTKSDLVAFFISETHERCGINKEVIEKMVETLGKTEKKESKVTYRVLIEIVGDGSPSLKPDLLDSLFTRIRDIPGVVVENIEVRKLSKIARRLLNSGVEFLDPRFFSYWYNEARDDEGAEAQRRRFEEVFFGGYKIETLTFDGVLEEFRQQREKAVDLRKLLPEREPDWQERIPVNSISFDFIACHDSAVKRLIDVLGEFNIKTEESILNATYKIMKFQADQESLCERDLLLSSQIEDGTAKLGKIRDALLSAGSSLFDFFLLHRMLELQKIARSDERVIVISGGDHVMKVTDKIKEYEFEECYREYGQSKVYDDALNPEQLAVIEWPLEVLKEKLIENRKEREEVRQINLELARKNGLLPKQEPIPVLLK